MAKKSDIRGSKKQWLLGKLAVFSMRLMRITLRFKLDDPTGQRPLADNGEPKIWAFWHNTLFAAPLMKSMFSGTAPASALASASNDGAVIESMLSLIHI